MRVRPNGWHILADHIRHEMARRGWTQLDLAEAANVGLRSINDLLNGREAKRMPRSILRVEAALGWPPGKARSILTGEPMPDEPPILSAEDRIRELPGLTDEEKRGLITYLRLMREQKETG